MNKYIVELLDAYRHQLNLIETYNIINTEIKEYVISVGRKAIIDKYALKVIEVDKSTYNEEIVDYLIEKDLTSFLIKEVDNFKVKNLMLEGVLDRNYILENIKRDKSVLDIIVPSIKPMVDKTKLLANLNDKVDARMVLKNEIAVAKPIYFEKSKIMKDILRGNNINEFRFEFENGVGLVRTRIVGREYEDEFVNRCKRENIDIFKYKIDNKKLKSSKLSKIIEDDIIQSARINKKENHLYIRKL